MKNTGKLSLGEEEYRCRQVLDVRGQAKLATVSNHFTEDDTVDYFWRSGRIVNDIPHHVKISFLGVELDSESSRVTQCLWTVSAVDDGAEA